MVFSTVPATEDKNAMTGSPDLLVSMQNAAVMIAVAIAIALTPSLGLKQNSKMSYLALF